MSDTPLEPAPPQATPPTRPWARLGLGCAALALGLAAVPLGGWYLWQRHAAEADRLAEAAQVERVEMAAAPALQKLSALAQPGQPYDIDETVRVIHEIDLAMKDQASMEDYLQYMASRDYRGVAPEVLEARRRLLEQQARLYALQTEAADQQASWEFSRDLMLQTLSVVQVSGQAGTSAPQAGFAVDSAQARKLLDELAAKQAAHEALARDIRAEQEAIFHAMLDEGVYLAPSAFEAGFVSIAHGDAEIDATIAAAARAFRRARG